MPFIMATIAYLPCVKMSLSVTVSDEMYSFEIFAQYLFQEIEGTTKIHLMDLTLLSIRPYLL